MAPDDNPPQVQVEGRKTRATNQSQHPGGVILPRTRRPTEEVEQARQAAAAQRDELAQAKTKAKGKVATIQADLEAEEDILNQIRSDPFRAKSAGRSTPRKSSNQKKGSAREATKKKATSSACKAVVDDDVSDSNDLEYRDQPQMSNVVGAGDDAGDADPPLQSPPTQDDAPPPNIEKRKRKKDSVEEPAEKTNKSKAGTKKVKLASHLEVSGVRKDWEAEKRRAAQEPEKAEGVSGEGEVVRLGGIVGSDEEADDVARQAYKKVAGDSASSRAKPAKSRTFDPTKAPFTIDRKPLPPPKSQRAAHNGENKWKLSHLPAEISRDDFTGIFAPRVREKAGTIAPWEMLTKKEVQKLVDSVFRIEPKVVVDVDGALSGLVGYRINQWRNGFVKAASDAVKHLLDQQSDLLDTKSRIKTFINMYFEEVTPESNSQIRTVAFHWKTWKDGKKKGFFQNPLIIRTFATAHLALINAEGSDKLDAGSSKKHWPLGALVLSAQAVEHILKSWVTGTFVPTPGPAGFFSADNYADYDERQPGPQKGRAATVRINRATRYLPTLKTFDDAQWAKIYKGAMTYITPDFTLKFRTVNMLYIDNEKLCQILHGYRARVPWPASGLNTCYRLFLSSYHHRHHPPDIFNNNSAYMQRERSDEEEVDCRCSICLLAGPNGRVQTRVTARRHEARDLNRSIQHHPGPNPSFPTSTRSNNTQSNSIFRLDDSDDEPAEAHDDMGDGNGSGDSEGDEFEAQADHGEGGWGQPRVRFELDVDGGEEEDEDEPFIGTGQANGAGPVFEDLTDDPLFREQLSIWEPETDDGPDTSSGSGDLDLPPAFSESALRRNFYVHVFLGSAFEGMTHGAVRLMLNGFSVASRYVEEIFPIPVAQTLATVERRLGISTQDFIPEAGAKRGLGLFRPPSLKIQWPDLAAITENVPQPPQAPVLSRSFYPISRDIPSLHVIYSLLIRPSVLWRSFYPISRNIPSSYVYVATGNAKATPLPKIISPDLAEYPVDNPSYGA
ncbi:hypothetical protein BDN72DRAFT_865539 [Pluteus cervinus]|uniref:Uncharacterized protein n=1 Tax=Pluteus cervinus TaxID=181527 RepID=A0ACD2ZZD6_9AGAR|nr:hypothetical protein BDN72DRAFT_865539 [Pluteus cervinus]